MVSWFWYQERFYPKSFDLSIFRDSFSVFLLRSWTCLLPVFSQMSVYPSPAYRNYLREKYHRQFLNDIWRIKYGHCNQVRSLNQEFSTHVSHLTKLWQPTKVSFNASAFFPIAKFYSKRSKARQLIFQTEVHTTLWNEGLVSYLHCLLASHTPSSAIFFKCTNPVSEVRHYRVKILICRPRLYGFDIVSEVQEQILQQAFLNFFVSWTP